MQAQVLHAYPLGTTVLKELIQVGKMQHISGTAIVAGAAVQRLNMHAGTQACAVVSCCMHEQHPWSVGGDPGGGVWRWLVVVVS